MKAISKIFTINDDIVLGELSDNSIKLLYKVTRDGNDYYKIKIDNVLCPVGTPKSGVMLTELTKFYFA